MAQWDKLDVAGPRLGLQAWLQNGTLAVVTVNDCAVGHGCCFTQGTVPLRRSLSEAPTVSGLLLMCCALPMCVYCAYSSMIVLTVLAVCRPDASSLSDTSQAAQPSHGAAVGHANHQLRHLIVNRTRARA